MSAFDASVDTVQTLGKGVSEWQVNGFERLDNLGIRYNRTIMEASINLQSRTSGSSGDFCHCKTLTRSLLDMTTERKG